MVASSSSSSRRLKTIPLRQLRRRLERQREVQGRLQNLAAGKLTMMDLMEKWLHLANPDVADEDDEEGTSLLLRGMQTSQMLHIGLGRQNKEDAIQTFKMAVLDFAAAHAGQVQAEGGNDIEKSMPDWNYVHYAELHTRNQAPPATKLYLLLEYIPWAEEASVFVSVLPRGTDISAPLMPHAPKPHEKQLSSPPS